MKINVQLLFAMCCVVILASPLLAQENREVKNAPLDFAMIHVAKISRVTPMRVREFDPEAADLGKKIKHRDEALEMAKVAPGELSQELLRGLKANGFKDVAIVKEGEELPATCLVIDGNFTVLNPGSRYKRSAWGFGAGKTKVCIRGSVLDMDSKSLADFSNCRKGLGWGSATPQMSGDTVRMGDQIAQFVAEWADGRYAY